MTFITVKYIEKTKKEMESNCNTGQGQYLEVPQNSPTQTSHTDKICAESGFS